MLDRLQAFVSFSADKGFILYLFQPWQEIKTNLN